MRFSLDASWNGNYKIETISTNETKQNKAKKTSNIYLFNANKDYIFCTNNMINQTNQL